MKLQACLGLLPQGESRARANSGGTCRALDEYSGLQCLQQAARDRSWLQTFPLSPKRSRVSTQAVIGPRPESGCSRSTVHTAFLSSNRRRPCN